MRLGKFAFITLLFTVVAFIVSYAMAPKSESEPFPISLIAPWKNTKIVADVQGLKQVRIQKELPSEAVEKLHLQLEAADVELLATDANLITLSLDGHFSLENPLEVTQTPGEVLVKVKEEDARTIFNGANGKLTIAVPVSVRDLQIETVNGLISGNITNLRNMNIASVSGDVKLADIKVPVVKIATVSGDVELSGDLSSLNLVSVSGDVSIKSQNPSPALNLNSTSGDIELAFHSQPDLTVRFKSMNGDARILGQPGAEETILGKGAGSVTVETISGDLSIRRL